MRKILKTMRLVKAELRTFPAFYALLAVGGPVLYAVLLWLDQWGATPAS